MQVEIWSDVVCPWCYLGKRYFEQALERFPHRDGVEVIYRSFELDPSAPPGVTTPTVETLAGKYGMGLEQAREAQRQMEQRAAQAGLTFRMEDLRSGNTRDAHRLLQMAGARGRGAELAERLHRAYFTDQASIFDHAHLPVSRPTWAWTGTRRWPSWPVTSTPRPSRPTSRWPTRWA